MVHTSSERHIRATRDARSKILENASLVEDWELLSVIFGSGIRNKDVYSLSRDLLHSMGGLHRILNTTASQLPTIPGLGRAKTSILISLAEIIRRVHKRSLEESSEYFPFLKLYHTLWGLTGVDSRESFFLVNFNLEGHLLRIHRLSQGSLTEVGVHKRDLAKIVLDDCSGYCLVAHNHPRHSAQPSEEDIFLFENLRQFLTQLEVECIDHWVIGSNGLYSILHDSILDTESWHLNNLPKDYQFLADN